jgi:hypothetical protein
LLIVIPSLDNASAVNTMDVPPKPSLALRAGFVELIFERLL